MIGLLPCAGKAERFHGLPKYMLPCPGGRTLIEHHIDMMENTGCKLIYVGANDANIYDLENDIDARMYLAQNYNTMTQTVLSSNLIIHKENRILFGMPDTYFIDATAYQQVAVVDADVVVGCFRIPPNEQHKHDLVRVERGRVVEVLNKPALHSSLQCTWGILLWKPVFWDYLRPEDPHVGHGLPRAIAAGLDVRPVIIEGGYWNIGTTEDYFDMIRTVGQGERVEA